MPSKRNKKWGKKREKRGELFSFLLYDSDQETTQLASKHIFRQNLQEQMG